MTPDDHEDHHGTPDGHPPIAVVDPREHNRVMQGGGRCALAVIMLVCTIPYAVWAESATRDIYALAQTLHMGAMLATSAVMASSALAAMPNSRHQSSTCALCLGGSERPDPRGLALVHYLHEGPWPVVALPVVFVVVGMVGVLWGAYHSTLLLLGSAAVAFSSMGTLLYAYVSHPRWQPHCPQCPPAVRERAAERAAQARAQQPSTDYTL